MTTGSLTSPSATAHERPPRSDALKFSLYYFTGQAPLRADPSAYRFVLETARFGDEHGFHAVWTPERHFHQFGGLFPNPVVTSAALAVLTERVQIRAGSVVVPLHHPVRLVEDWSVVDNLSNGRVGISVATGWHVRDFVIRPEAFHDRVDIAHKGIEQIRRLWAGEEVVFRGVDGCEQAVRSLPRPVQPSLPIWITSSGSEQTLRTAGRMGTNVLTSLMDRSVSELGEMLEVYFGELEAAGHRREDVEVTVMLHTFLGASDAGVRDVVEGPLQSYLRSYLRQHEDAGTDVAGDDEEHDRRVKFAFERYFRKASLLGTPDKCATLLEQLTAVGVTEVACLIDFGVGLEDAVGSLRLLDELRASFGGNTT